MRKKGFIICSYGRHESSLATIMGVSNYVFFPRFQLEAGVNLHPKKNGNKVGWNVGQRRYRLDMQFNPGGFQGGFRPEIITPES